MCACICVHCMCACIYVHCMCPRAHSLAVCSGGWARAAATGPQTGAEEPSSWRQPQGSWAASGPSWEQPDDGSWRFWSSCPPVSQGGGGPGDEGSQASTVLPETPLPESCLGAGGVCVALHSPPPPPRAPPPPPPRRSGSRCDLVTHSSPAGSLQPGATTTPLGPTDMVRRPAGGTRDSHPSWKCVCPFPRPQPLAPSWPLADGGPVGFLGQGSTLNIPAYTGVPPFTSHSCACRGWGWVYSEQTVTRGEKREGAA